ncbi:MAG: hypothetical protein AAF821_20010 [Cyanobacteria bacterium P01_D01_bin.156]
MGRATLETFEMALVGTIFGAVLSLPLSILAAKNTTPSPWVFSLSRGLVTLLRVVPDPGLIQCDGIKSRIELSYLDC